MGTSCRFCSRFWAVTMISSIPPLLSAGVLAVCAYSGVLKAVAASAAIAIVLDMLWSPCRIVCPVTSN